MSVLRTICLDAHLARRQIRRRPWPACRTACSAPLSPFALSQALLGEYRIALTRPALRKPHTLSVAEIEQLLTDLAWHAIVIATSGPAIAAQRAPDAGDQFLWPRLAARPDIVQITGDKRLLQDAATRSRGVSPRAFVAGA